jgi:hypothetical protein
VEVVFNGLAWIFRLFVLAGRDGRGNGPVEHQNWNRGEETEEDGRVQAAADLTCEIGGSQDQQGNQDGIGEAVAPGSVGRQRCIFDGRILPSSEDISTGHFGNCP